MIMPVGNDRGAGKRRRRCCGLSCDPLRHVLNAFRLMTVHRDKYGFTNLDCGRYFPRVGDDEPEIQPGVDQTKSISDSTQRADPVVAVSDLLASDSDLTVIGWHPRNGGLCRERCQRENRLCQHALPQSELLVNRQVIC